VRVTRRHDDDVARGSLVRISICAETARVTGGKKKIKTDGARKKLKKESRKERKRERERFSDSRFLWLLTTVVNWPESKILRNWPNGARTAQLYVHAPRGIMHLPPEDFSHLDDSACQRRDVG